MKAKSNILAYYALLRKIKAQLKPSKKIFAVYGEGAVTDQMCQKWFAKFCARDFLLDNAPPLGGPVEVDSDQLKTLRTINIIPRGR